VAPPSNDLIANAINLNLGPVPYTQTDVNFPEATFTADGDSAGCNVVTAGIWYKFTATDAGSVSAFIQTNDGANVVFYTAPDDDATSGLELTYVDQASNPCGSNNFASINTTIGTVYYIYMKNLVISTVAINVTNAFHLIDNDQLSSATEVDINIPYNLYSDIHFLMATSDADGGQAGCDTEQIAGVWYYLFATDVMNVYATMSSDPNVSALVFYTAINGAATSGDDLTFVNQPENTCGLGDETTIVTEPNTWYYLFAATSEPYANVTIHNSVLGVSENELEGFVYYPNPFTNELNLSAKTTIDEVLIFNLMGQKVFSLKINATKKSIDLSHLPTGMYVLEVNAEGTSATYKIVKQ
jgi:hypothetical protein